MSNQTAKTLTCTTCGAEIEPGDETLLGTDAVRCLACAEGEDEEPGTASSVDHCGGCGCEVDERTGWTHCSGGGPECGDRCPDCGTHKHE